MDEQVSLWCADLERLGLCPGEVELGRVAVQCREVCTNVHSGDAILDSVAVSRFPFHTSSPAFVIICFLGDGHPYWVEMTSQNSFSAKGTECLLKYLLTICISSVQFSLLASLLIG